MVADMPSIYAAIDELSVRPNAVREMLHPLVAYPGGERGPGFIRCEKAKVFRRGQYVLGVHGGGVSDAADYPSWRFSTYRTDFRCRYYEVWEPTDGRHLTYALNRAYFTLFRVSSRPAREDTLLALHCDPIIEDTERHAAYKQGPHLHLDVAGDPLSHAHIALDRIHLAEILESVGSLSSALAAAVIMLKEQVLELGWPEVA